MKIVVLDALTLGEDTDLSPLLAAGETTVYSLTAPEEIPERVRDANVVVTNKLKMNARSLAGAKALQLVCVTATGFDNIDLDYCRSRGIGVCNVPAYSAFAVAQLTAAMVLSLSCRLSEYREFVHSGQYSAGPSANRLTPVWHELAGKTWGIVGCGSIGSRTAAIAESLGCRVIVYRRRPEGPWPVLDLDSLLEQSDIVSVHLPLNDTTRGILSRQRIERLKPGAILINTARGALCDEQALSDAVLSGRLGGLGVDAFSTEPLPEGHPFTELLGLPNVILTPHTAWGALESRNRCIAVTAENIIAFGKNTIHNRLC